MREELFQQVYDALMNEAIDQTRHCRISELSEAAQWAVALGPYESYQVICGM